jgi:hypothetical protein
MLRDRIKPYIDQIVRRELTNRAVAAELGVSEHHVCRVLKALNVVRNPAPTRDNKAALIQERKDFRASVAASMSVTDAARAANCSTRTIYRYRAS